MEGLLESRLFREDHPGKMAEWSNAPDSKSGVQVLLYRGFESLSFRQCIPHFGSLAQLVERLPYTQNVGSSSLSRPTIHKPPTGNGAGLLFWLKRENL